MCVYAHTDGLKLDEKSSVYHIKHLYNMAPDCDQNVCICAVCKLKFHMFVQVHNDHWVVLVPTPALGAQYTARDARSFMGFTSSKVGTELYETIHLAVSVFQK